MADTKGFDTSVLVYAFNADEKEKHQKALELLENVYKGEFKGFLSIQNLNELFYVITRKNIKNIKEAEEIIKNIIGSNKWIVKDIGKDTALLAINLTKNNSKNFWDNLIAANLILNDVREIYTEDTKGFKSELIKVINPFR